MKFLDTPLERNGRSMDLSFYYTTTRIQVLFIVYIGL